MEIRELTNAVEDAIDKGTAAIGAAHKRLARVPYDLASQVRPLAGTARKGREIQDRFIDLFYGSVRNVNHAVFRRVKERVGGATVPEAGHGEAGAPTPDPPPRPRRGSDGGAIS